MDPSDHPRFQQQIRLFEAISATTPDFIYAFDLNGRFTFVNKPLLDLWGLSLDQALGKNFHDLHYPDDLAARLQRQIQEVIQTQHRVVDETRYVSPTGVEGWYQYIFSAIVGSDGRVEAVAGSTRDISDRKRSETRDRFLLALDSAVRPLADPAEITATHARLLGEHLKVDRCAYADVEADQDTFNLTGDYNNNVPSIVGRYRFAQFGQQVLDLMRRDLPFVVDDVDTHQPPVGDLSAYRATMIQAVICVPLHKDGRFVAAMAVHQKYPRHWTREDVELVGYVAARCWESIERARVERTLRESEAQFRAIFEHSTAGIFQLDMDGWFVVVNQWMCDLLGYERAELLNMSAREITHPDEQQGNRDLLEKAARDRQTFVLETRYICKHGAAVWVSISVNVVFDRRGVPQAILGIVTDLTDRRRAEEERQTLLESERHARAEAERASRMKDEFLATLSHELRTPLNAILGWAQILSAGPQNPENVREAVDIIERNARAQTQIIEDLLDMSRIISGKIRLNVQRVDLAAVIQAGMETVRPAADAKGVRLRAVLDPLAGFVSGDPNRLQQVFWNLLTNAVKFTSRGGSVQVALERVNSHLEVNVTDTGEGITADFVPYVFDRFRQAEGGTTRRHGGLGLGLAIVRQLVELHGGSVRVASGGPGKGSTFSVLLPLAVLQPQVSPTEIAAHLQKESGVSPVLADACVRLEGIKVLVVDDDPDARAMLKRFLEECDAIVSTTSSVHETFERLEADPPDVLVSDIGLPGEDGYSLIRKVRARAVDREKRLPAIALTAYARAEDRIKAIRAGFDMHVVKPVDPAELIAVIASLTGRGQEGR